jgi:signal transduction histidine kinase
VSIFKATYNQVKRVVRALPKPVVYTFPYALLLALAANVVVLSLQGWRELKSYRRLELFVTRERNISEAKLTLLELAAHYLRTPLTVLSGGIEMIASEGLQKAADSLKAITTRLHDAIEQLLVKTRQVAEDSSVTATQSALPGTVRIWRQPGLLLPPLLIALIVVPFDLVARNVKTLNVTQANLAAQLISYAFLVVLLYLAFRYVHLRRRETAQLELVGQGEAATARARDELMTDTTTMLASNITGIDQVVATLPVSGSVKFVTDGVARFHNMQDKLLVAARLRGSTSQEAPQAVQVNTLVHDAWQALAGTATPRNIQLKLTGDSTCYTPDPELLSTVIRSLLDNAIAYSTDNSVVQVNSEPLDNGVSITVSDTGKGIPQEKISLLFQPFFKAEGAETFTHEGMGFSLYLDRLIMNYIGGNITLESKPDHGTTVRLDLPG